MGMNGAGDKGRGVCWLTTQWFTRKNIWLKLTSREILFSIFLTGTSAPMPSIWNFSTSISFMSSAFFWTTTRGIWSMGHGMICGAVTSWLSALPCCTRHPIRRAPRTSVWSSISPCRFCRPVWSHAWRASTAFSTVTSPFIGLRAAIKRRSLRSSTISSISLRSRMNCPIWPSIINLRSF